MKVTLLTAASKDYWPLMALSSPNKLEYCLRHGVQLHVSVHYGNAGCYDNWGERVQFMADALSVYDCDWLWFMGADTLITDMTKDVRDLCVPEFDFIIGKDINGINNDSFLLKNSKASREFLKRVMYRRDAVTDQCAMKAEMEHEGMQTAIVSQRLFNSFKYDEYQYGPYPEGDWQEGDFVIHFPGMHFPRRVELMREFLGKVKR